MQYDRLAAQPVTTSPVKADSGYFSVPPRVFCWSHLIYAIDDNRRSGKPSSYRNRLTCEHSDDPG